MRLTRAGRAGPYWGRCLDEGALASPRFAGWNRPGSPRVPPSGAHRLARSPTFGRCDSHGPAEPALTWVAVPMKILVVGSGAREHAIAWKCVQSELTTLVYCAPGNGGTVGLARNVPVQAD